MTNLSRYAILDDLNILEKDKKYLSSALVIIDEIIAGTSEDPIEYHLNRLSRAIRLLSSKWAKSNVSVWDKWQALELIGLATVYSDDTLQQYIAAMKENDQFAKLKVFLQEADTQIDQAQKKLREDLETLSVNERELNKFVDLINTTIAKIPKWLDATPADPPKHFYVNMQQLETSLSSLAVFDLNQADILRKEIELFNQQHPDDNLSALLKKVQPQAVEEDMPAATQDISISEEMNDDFLNFSFASSSEESTAVEEKENERAQYKKIVSYLSTKHGFSSDIMIQMQAKRIVNLFDSLKIVTREGFIKLLNKHAVIIEDEDATAIFPDERFTQESALASLNVLKVRNNRLNQVSHKKSLREFETKIKAALVNINHLDFPVVIRNLLDMVGGFFLSNRRGEEGYFTEIIIQFCEALFSAVPENMARIHPKISECFQESLKSAPSLLVKLIYVFFLEDKKLLEMAHGELKNLKKIWFYFC